MSFKEDVFAKVITYITIAVLLGAMLVEAFVIYTERSEKRIGNKADEYPGDGRESVSAECRSAEGESGASGVQKQLEEFW